MNKKKSKKVTESKKSDKSKNLNVELQETKDKYLRLYSEFENFRRRTSKEKIDMIDSANKELLSDILPVIDDFERASKSIKKENESDLEGYNLIYQKLINTLEKYGPTIFLDADMLVLGDIQELQSFVNGQHSVYVRKSDNQFEWPSLMVFDNAKCQKLTTEYIEDQTSNPQSFEWAESVGDLPEEWNFCVGYI